MQKMDRKTLSDTENNQIKPANSSYAGATEEEREISLQEFIQKLRVVFKYLALKWFVVLFGFIVGGFIGLLYAYYSKPEYFAETTFVLEDGGSGGSMLGQLGGLAGLAGIEVGGGGGLFEGENIIQLYKSRNMIEKTLLATGDSEGKELLIDRYISMNKLRENWEGNPKLAIVDFKNKGNSRTRDSIISIIVNDIKKNYLIVSKPDKKLNIISVKVKSKDEVFAKDFVDNIVNKVNTFYVETKTRKSINNIRILQQKTDSIRATMSGAINQSAATLDATPNINQVRQVLRTSVLKNQFNTEANKLILGELVKNLELSKMALLQETPLIQVIDQPVFPLYKEQIGFKKSIIIGAGLGMIFASIFLIARLFYGTYLK